MSLTTYFSIAVNMADGEKLVIPCVNDRDQESKRVQLYRIRKVYSERVDGNAANFISIYRSTLRGNPCIVLERKAEPDIKPFILGEAGEIRSIKEGESSLDIERYVSAAISDGLSLRDLLVDTDSAHMAKMISEEWERQASQMPSEINLEPSPDKDLFAEEGLIIKHSEGD